MKSPKPPLPAAESAKPSSTSSPKTFQVQWAEKVPQLIKQGLTVDQIEAERDKMIMARSKQRFGPGSFLKSLKSAHAQKTPEQLPE